MSDRDNENRREPRRDNTWLWILVIAALAFVIFSGNSGEVNAGPVLDASSVTDRSINVQVEPAQVTVPVHVEASQSAQLTGEQIVQMCWAWVDSPDIGWFADWDEARPECGQTPIGSPVTQPPSR